MLVHLESQRIFPVTTVRSFSMTFTFNDLVDAFILKKKSMIEMGSKGL